MPWKLNQKLDSGQTWNTQRRRKDGNSCEWSGCEASSCRGRQRFSHTLDTLYACPSGACWRYGSEGSACKPASYKSKGKKRCLSSIRYLATLNLPTFHKFCTHEGLFAQGDSSWCEVWEWCRFLAGPHRLYTRTVWHLWAGVHPGHVPPECAASSEKNTWRSPGKGHTGIWNQEYYYKYGKCSDQGI